MKYYLLKRVDYTKIKKYIKTIVHDIDTLKKITTVIKTTVDKFTIYQKVRTSGHNWVTQPILTAINSKNELFRKLKQQNFSDPTVLTRHKGQKNQVTSLVRKD